MIAPPRRTLRVAMLLLTAALMATPLAGCGRKGVPHPPGPSDQIIYPKPYPTR